MNVTVTAPATGLVGAWGFNENAGTVAADASGNGRTATIRQAIWVAGGKYGASLAFDGINDWVTVTDHASLRLTAGVTVEAWVKPGTMNGWETVVMKERGAAAHAYALYAHDGGACPRRHRSISQRARWPAYHRTLRGPATLPPGVWSHLAMTYDGATLRLFVNGSKVASRAQSGPIDAGAGALRIGGNNSWTGEFFQGKIDEVRIYNRALSQPEIETDMNTPIPYLAHHDQQRRPGTAPACVVVRCLAL